MRCQLVYDCMKCCNMKWHCTKIQGVQVHSICGFGNSKHEISLSRFPVFFIYERHNFPLRKTQFCIYFKGGVSSPNVNQRRWSRASQLIWPHVKPPPTLQITILCIFPAGWWVMNISTIPDKLGTLILTSFIQSLLGFLRQFVLLPTAFFK